MTATKTRTRTAGDLQVTSTATLQDAQLVMSILNGPTAMRALDGMQALWAYTEPPTWEEFDSDYPRTSTTAADVAAVLNLNETIGTFVKQGLLDRGLVYDLLWVKGAWEQCQHIALHMREAADNPEIYANFERLAAAQP